MSDVNQNEYVYPRRSLAGPVVLICIGTFLLLANFHVISWPNVAHYFARYWPVLIIVWGVIKLLEYMSDQRAGVRPRGIGAGGVFLLILLIIVGLSATGAERVNWGAVRNDIDIDSDFGGWFGNSYTYTQTLQQAFDGNTLRVVSDRGDITVNTWTEPGIKVIVHKKVVAENEDKAKSVDQQTQPTFTSAGSTLTLNANTGAAGSNALVQSDLEIYLPRSAVVDLTTRRGDINVNARDAEVRISTAHGDGTVQDVKGNASLEVRHGSVRASNVTGDVAVSGPHVDDTTVNDVKGSLRLTGDFFGDMNLSHVTGMVAFKSSRTDMEMARLDGDLNLQSGDLHAKSVGGPVRILTRSKDIRLEDFSGDVHIENTNGSIELQPVKLPLGNIDVTNRRGEVQLVLPERATFQLEASARRGEISSEFDAIKVDSSRHEARAAGTVGNGGPKLQISSDFGNVDIRKGMGSEAPATPAPPAPPSPPAPRRKS